MLAGCSECFVLLAKTCWNTPGCTSDCLRSNATTLRLGDHLESPKIADLAFADTLVVPDVDEKPLQPPRESELGSLFWPEVDLPQCALLADATATAAPEEIVPAPIILLTPSPKKPVDGLQRPASGKSLKDIPESWAHDAATTTPEAKPVTTPHTLPFVGVDADGLLLSAARRDLSGLTQDDPPSSPPQVPILTR